MDRVYKRKKKNFSYPLKIVFFLIIIGACSYFCSKYRVDLKVIDAVQTLSQDIKAIPKKVKAEDQNYSSENMNLLEGQSLVKNADGYTKTFTTLSENNKKTYKEFKQNLDTASWSEKSYWGGTMRENGCGITSLAIIASGYGLDYVTPESLREEFYPHLNGEKIPDVLEDMGIECTGFYYDEEYLSKKYIMDWLKTNRPIIICVGNNEKNKWTTSSHYMTILDINSKGFVYLSNPNRIRWGE